MSSRPTDAVAIRPTELTRLVHEVSLMMARIFNRRMKEIGLTRAQWQVLHQLNRRDGQTQTELADLLVIARPPLGKIVDRLEADGWVLRREDAADRRVKRVFLTSKADSLIEPLETQVNEIACYATEHFNEQELKNLKSTLLKMHGNLSARDDSRCN
jgi:DNA-binding MarR family transcriptional regulator